MKRPTDQPEKEAWIERYLLGQMPPAEQQYLEDEMSQDTALREEVTSQREIFQNLQKALLEQQVRQTVQRFQQRERVWGRVRRIGQYVSVGMAASLVFLLYFSLSPIQFSSNENDFTIVRGADTTQLSTQRKIIFEQFFDGQAHLAEGQYLLAARNFETVLQSNDLRPYFKEATQWHLIVAYLKSGDVHRADQMFQKFSNCTDCEYDVGTFTKIKIRCQIWWAKLQK
ncbi:MAG: hypothetical protein ACK4GN_04080 [Runella sp.]